MRDIVDDPVHGGQVSVSLPVAAGRRVHRGHGGGDPEGAPHRPHLRPRGRHVADAHGDQQADHRGGPLRRGRRRLQPGLAPGQALLPDRPAHRARRGRPRHRRARGPLRRDRPAPPEVGDGGGLGGRIRAQAAHAVPVVRAGHGGRARAQGGAAARRRPVAPAASPSAGTTRRPRSPRGWPAGATGAWAP